MLSIIRPPKRWPARKIPSKAGEQIRTVWDIPNNKDRSELRYGKHPTQKPLRLLKRMLALSATAGHVLLAPFAGAGSECVAAAEMGLHFLGFETEAEYVEIARPHGSARRVLNRSSLRKKSGTARDSRPVERLSCVPSLIKWTGSKRSQATAIVRQMPEHQRYFEPFLGGRALLYLAARPGSVAGDVYEPLVALSPGANRAGFGRCGLCAAVEGPAE